MGEFIARQEFEEFKLRIESEDNRQNRRIELLEENVKNITALTVSVEKMAMSIDGMAKELTKQGEKLQQLEEIPSQNWNTIRTSIISAIASAVGTALIMSIIHFV